MLYNPDFPPEKERQDTVIFPEGSDELLAPILRIYTEVLPQVASTAIFEVTVTVENSTLFSLSELRLEGGSNTLVRLVSLPFFEQVRQLGRLEARQKSSRQLFRYRWEAGSGPLEQAMIEFRISGQLEYAGTHPVNLLVLVGLMPASARCHQFNLTSFFPL